jgi:hypothetical protein
VGQAAPAGPAAGRARLRCASALGRHEAQAQILGAARRGHTAPDLAVWDGRRRCRAPHTDWREQHFLQLHGAVVAGAGQQLAVRAERHPGSRCHRGRRGWPSFSCQRPSTGQFRITVRVNGGQDPVSQHSSDRALPRPRIRPSVPRLSIPSCPACQVPRAVRQTQDQDETLSPWSDILREFIRYVK